MDAKQKRIAIAELTGYKKVRYEWRNWDGHPIQDLKGELEPECREVIPDCFSDLNVTFEAWKKLNKHQSRIFTHVLCAIVVGKPLKELPSGNDNINRFAAAVAINATASQRVDAILITIGKINLWRLNQEALKASKTETIP